MGTLTTVDARGDIIMSSRGIRQEEQQGSVANSGEEDIRQWVRNCRSEVTQSLGGTGNSGETVQDPHTDSHRPSGHKVKCNCSHSDNDENICRHSLSSGYCRPYHCSKAEYHGRCCATAITSPSCTSGQSSSSQTRRTHVKKVCSSCQGVEIA